MTESFNVYGYSIPLRASVTVGGASKNESRGFLIHRSCAGADMWAEVAPLDGYSIETYDEVRAGLLAMKPTLPGLELLGHRFPSVAWAVSVLQAEVPASDSVKTGIPIARLITGGDSASILHGVSDAVASGYSCIKLKVGSRRLEEDIELVRSVCRIIPDTVSLRLDANRQWTLAQALAFAHAVSDLSIAFIEEPLRDGRDYDALEHAVALPLALDESLARHPSWADRKWNNLKAVVIKPMLHGGCGSIRRIIDWASGRGAYTVVSSMYETGVGMRSLLNLAAVVSPGIPAGLDTYSFLSGDIALPPLTVVDGRYVMDRAVTVDWIVETKSLEKIL